MTDFQPSPHEKWVRVYMYFHLTPSWRFFCLPCREQTRNTAAVADRQMARVWVRRLGRSSPCPLISQSASPCRHGDDLPPLEQPLPFRQVLKKQYSFIIYKDFTMILQDFKSTQVTFPFLFLFLSEVPWIPQDLKTILILFIIYLPVFKIYFPISQLLFLIYLSFI